MKLAKKDAQRLQGILADLDRAIAFVKEERTAIVRKHGCASLPNDTWTNGAGERGIAITKDIGSDLCGLYSAREKLALFISGPVIEPETNLPGITR